MSLGLWRHQPHREMIHCHQVARLSKPRGERPRGPRGSGLFSPSPHVPHAACKAALLPLPQEVRQGAQGCGRCRQSPRLIEPRYILADRSCGAWIGCTGMRLMPPVTEAHRAPLHPETAAAFLRPRRLRLPLKHSALLRDLCVSAVRSLQRHTSFAFPDRWVIGK